VACAQRDERELSSKIDHRLKFRAHNAPQRASAMISAWFSFLHTEVAN
jgi:hypothetical protein